MSRIALFALVAFVAIVGGVAGGLTVSTGQNLMWRISEWYAGHTPFEPASGIQEDDDPIIEPPVVVEDAPGFRVQRIFFGTDRDIAEDTGYGPVFGHGRSGELTVGYTDVSIPHTAHRLGEIERPDSLTLFWIEIWEEAEDPKRHFTIRGTQVLSAEEFQAMAAETTADAQRFSGTAFVFIHGFNTTFRAASFRAAQLAYDLQFDGPAFLYSWPSVGETTAYGTDMDSAEIAVPHMDEFLDMVFGVDGVEQVHILAHSMGNAALAGLLTRAGTRLAARNDKPVTQMVLAAPDIDAERFRSIAHHFTRVAEGVTIYAASTDRALLVSKSLRNNHVRLGDVGPEGPMIVPGIDTIDVSAVGTEVLSLNHNIYARNRALLDDLGQLWRSGERPPTARMSTTIEKPTANGPYWLMPD